MYAYADTEMKREAIARAEACGTSTRPLAVKGIWEDDEDLIARLCGLI